jgi:formylglycine-generating enzyme required for sulfatase activity
MAQAQIAPSELVAPKLEISDGILKFTIQPSVSGRNYQLQWSDSMAGGTWPDLGVLRSGDGGQIILITPFIPSATKRFFRVALTVAPTSPEGFSYIAAGEFTMGDQSEPRVGFSGEFPPHAVTVSAYYIGKHEVTKAMWDEVRAWGLTHGYTDLPEGGGKAPNHPIQTVGWLDTVKWCNAKSEKDGLTPCYTASGAVIRVGNNAIVCDWNANGYRLPTEAEWEKAARGGLSGFNFPLGNTISQSVANYRSGTTYDYETGPTKGSGYHPVYNDGVMPYTSPVESFPANGYGLHDMDGNVWEWCWDLWGLYPETPQTDPTGDPSGIARVIRGGSWGYWDGACYARCSFRYIYWPGTPTTSGGFRLVRKAS